MDLDLFVKVEPTLCQVRKRVSGRDVRVRHIAVRFQRSAHNDEFVVGKRFDLDAEATCSHRAIRTGSGRKAARVASFKWVNTALGNIKCAVTGTYRKLGPDHTGRYLASFAWRYNPRYQLQTMIPRFVHSAARTNPMPYRLLIAG